MKKAIYKFETPIAVGIGLIALSFAIVIFHSQIARATWEKFSLSIVVQSLNWSDASLSMKAGNYYFNGGGYDIKKAKLFYNQALFINPIAPLAHYQLGRIYFIEGYLNSARREIQKELLVNPEFVRSYYMLGLIHGFLGDFEKAEEDFRTFIRFYPAEWAGYNDLAWILLQRRKYDEVENIVSLAFEHVPDGDKNPWLWNNLGVAQLHTERYYYAEESFKKARLLAQNLTSTMWSRAYPGNDPAQATEGMYQFKDAIKKNLQRAQDRK